MKYYRYDPDADRFAGIGFDTATGEPIMAVHDIDSPVGEGWVVPTAHGFEDNPPREGDFPSLSNYNVIPVMSDRAWEALRPAIGYCCEPLPFAYPADLRDESCSSGAACSGKRYWIIHVMETIDCLDVERSEVSRNQATGRINDISLYGFKLGLLEGKHIFKLPTESGGELLVDDVFRNAVAEHKLKGLLFKELPMA